MSTTTRPSSSPLAGCPMVLCYVRSRPSRASKICRGRATCSVWARPWSGSPAPASAKCRRASRSTSTTLSMPSMAASNQLRLMLHTGAYWFIWSLRRLMPACSSWRVAQFDTLRLRLLKLAARMVAWKTRVMVHLPTACPDQAILRLALERLPRLVCYLTHHSGHAG